MKKIYAVIPAKESSGRLPSKNFIDFYDGRSLLEVKIDQCLASKMFDEIFISSDSDQAKKIAKRAGVEFLHRETKYCIDETPWSDVIRSIVRNIPVSDEDFIQWTHVTNPLFHRFQDVFLHLSAHDESDSVTTVTAYRHFMLNSDYIPINHVWGPWHAASQNIKPVYQMNLACSLATKKTMVDNGYIIGTKPKFYEISLFEGLDIDTLEEFEIAKQLYPTKGSGSMNTLPHKGIYTD